VNGQIARRTVRVVVNQISFGTSGTTMRRSHNRNKTGPRSREDTRFTRISGGSQCRCVETVFSEITLLLFCLARSSRADDDNEIERNVKFRPRRRKHVYRMRYFRTTDFPYQAGVRRRRDGTSSQHICTCRTRVTRLCRS